jgi:DNA-binding MarR family transcriptional regulator
MTSSGTTPAVDDDAARDRPPARPSRTAGPPVGWTGTSRSLDDPAPAGREETLSELIGRLRLAMTRLGRQLRREDPRDLTLAGLSALSAVAAAGRLSLGELAEAERLSAPTVTRLVDRLEQAGLMRRLADELDRRVVRVELTEAGRDLLAVRWEQGNRWLLSRLESLGPHWVASLEQAVDLLEALVDTGEDPLRAPPPP